MRSWFDSPLDAIPNDGASATTGLFMPADPEERETLLDAWRRERQENIELGLYLEQACALLRRMSAADMTTPANRRRAKELIRAIEAARRDEYGPTR